MISHRKYITRNLSCQINVLFPYHMWLQYTIDKRLMTTRYHDNIINKFLTLKIYPSNNNNIKWDIRVNHIFIFRYVNINYIWLLSTIIIEMYRCDKNVNKRIFSTSLGMRMKQNIYWNQQGQIYLWVHPFSTHGARARARARAHGHVYLHLHLRPRPRLHLHLNLRKV